MTSLLVTSLPKFLKKWHIDGSNSKWELDFWLQIKYSLNQSDDVTNVFDDVICNEFWLVNLIECLTKRNFACFFLISFKLGKIMLWIYSVDWRSKTVLSVKLWSSNLADKI